MATEIRSVPMLDHEITGPQAWTGETVSARDYVVPIPPQCAAELQLALDVLRQHRVPTLLLDPADFELAACRDLMQTVREKLDRGTLFAVLDRLALADKTIEDATAQYWLLASLLARPVPQKFDGTMFYDVRDTGATMKPGSGIRPTVTNLDLTFHNDNSYNETPPHYVALLCLSKSKSGGVSRVMSVATIHNELLKRYPEALPRLYRPFWYDRHKEHLPQEPNAHVAPLFTYDGQLRARIALHEIFGGYELRGETMDDETAEAIAAVHEVFDTPGLSIELQFEPGQIQFVNNRATGHARTSFTDGDGPAEKRHLIRLWLRDAGRRSYRG